MSEPGSVGDFRFSTLDLDTLIAAGQSNRTPVLRWIPRALSVGLEAQQSRDWGETVEPAEAVEEVLLKHSWQLLQRAHTLMTPCIPMVWESCF
jgi:hypothetical protein